MIIRPATAVDVIQVIALQDRCFPNDKKRIDETKFVDLLNSTNCQIIVAYIENCFAGYIVLTYRKWRPWLSCDFLAVHENYRKKGVGLSLLKGAILGSKRPFLRLFTEVENISAQSLYRQLGFRCVGKKIDHYGNNLDALVLMTLCWFRTIEK